MGRKKSTGPDAGDVAGKVERLLADLEGRIGDCPGARGVLDELRKELHKPAEAAPTFDVGADVLKVMEGFGDVTPVFDVDLGELLKGLQDSKPLPEYDWSSEADVLKGVVSEVWRRHGGKSYELKWRDGRIEIAIDDVARLTIERSKGGLVLSFVESK